MIRHHHQLEAIAIAPVNIPEVTFNDLIYMDVITEIFLKFRFKDFGISIPLVCKKFNQLANDPHLLKKIIFFNETFNPHDWNFFFPHMAFTELQCQQAFDTLPNDIAARLKNRNPGYPFSITKMCDSHVIVWMPANLSIDKYDQLIQKYFPRTLDNNLNEMKEKIKNLHRSKILTQPDINSLNLRVSQKVINEFGNLETTKAEWLILPKESFCFYEGFGSEMRKSDIARLSFPDYEDESRFPKSLELMVCISCIFMKRAEKILNWQAIICNEVIDGSRLIATNTADFLSLDSWNDGMI